ncbi:MAG TPA: DUF547 domain-containing protein [Candidatus Krumholzibacteria bacterium]
MKWLLATMFLVCATAHDAPAATPVYDDYRAVLMAFVDESGLVDYAALKDQRGYLDDFVRYLASVTPAECNAWSADNRMAFWINAYNALTLRAIIDHYPIGPAEPNRSYPLNSIRQIPGVFDRMRVQVAGEEITLAYIETKHLREDFREPRIHVALVCAAMSCPTLRREPYEGAKLAKQLDDQARDFLSRPRNFAIDRDRGVVRVSEIFRWYQDDFLPAARPQYELPAKTALRAFTSPYLSRADRDFVQTARIEYIPYDWALNEQPR